MKLFKYLTALVIGVLVTSAQADTFGLHVASYHFSNDKFNNLNFGAYWRSDSGLTLGGYRNSYYRNSLYAGWTFTDENDRFALTLGAVSGYTKSVYHAGTKSIKLDYVSKPQPGSQPYWEEHHVIRPLAIISVKLTDNLRVSYIPKFEKSVALIHFSVETKF